MIGITIYPKPQRQGDTNSRHAIKFHYSDVSWASCCLKSPATRLIQANNKEHIKAPRYWPFVRETANGLHSQKASNAWIIIKLWRLHAHIPKHGGVRSRGPGSCESIRTDMVMWNIIAAENSDNAPFSVAGSEWSRRSKCRQIYPSV